MNLVFRILVPVAILLSTLMTVRWMMNNRPQPQMRRPPTPVTAVDAKTLQPVDYQVVIPSQGIVRPRTQSTLLPQVSGRITEISPNFRDGGFFEEGDILLRIDPSDYETAVISAKATLAQRESALEIEKAQHEQAVENWKLLGKGSPPNPLTLREPQLAEAKANVDSAKARVVEAERNLERTVIRAPYVGRILRKQVDVGQTVSPGNQLATIFAVDYVEVRLPLINEHLDYIDLPEDYRNSSSGISHENPKVTLTGRFGSKEVSWEGQIVRAEGAYDPGSRQLFVVAQVDDPYSQKSPGQPPLKVNQFVEAEIYGRKLEKVFVIPRAAVRDGKEVLLIEDKKTIRRRTINALWKDTDSVIVRGEINPGEVLCTTPMTFAVDGAEVAPTIDGAAPPRRGAGGGPPGMRQGGSQGPGKNGQGPGGPRKNGNRGPGAGRPQNNN